MPKQERKRLCWTRRVASSVGRVARCNLKLQSADSKDGHLFFKVTVALFDTNRRVCSLLPADFSRAVSLVLIECKLQPIPSAVRG